MNQTTIVFFEGTNRMVGIFGSPTIEYMNNDISFIIAIGIFEPKNTGLINNENATVVKLKTGGTMKFVVKNSTFISFAIVIGIFEDDKFIARFRIAWFPQWVTGHSRNPKSAFVVKAHLHRFSDFRKLSFISKKLDFVAGWNCARFDEFIRGKNFRSAFLIFAVLLSGFTKTSWGVKKLTSF